MADSRSPRRALVVEDDAGIRELLRLHLDLAGFALDEASDGRLALDRARSSPFDLILLDVMLPGLDGVSVCRAIRNGGPNVDTPIRMLTARDGESDKVLGLESGADDYLTKPFGVRELVARARALMRRPRLSRAGAGGGGAAGADGTALDGDVIRFRHVTIDPARRRVTLGKPDGPQDVELTGREFDLLLLLASHPGIVFSREALLARVWKGEAYVTERSVDTLIKRIRRSWKTIRRIRR
jgi:DNA-binding response OmpR family regulator